MEWAPAKTRWGAKDLCVFKSLLCYTAKQKQHCNRLLTHRFKSKRIDSGQEERVWLLLFVWLDTSAYNETPYILQYNTVTILTDEVIIILNCWQSHPYDSSHPPYYTHCVTYFLFLAPFRPISVEVPGQLCMWSAQCLQLHVEQWKSKLYPEVLAEKRGGWYLVNLCFLHG